VHLGEEPKVISNNAVKEEEDEAVRRCCSDGEQQNEALALRKRKPEINGNEINGGVENSAAELKKLKIEAPDEQQPQQL